jgi:large subunit ribosomal protein L25
MAADATISAQIRTEFGKGAARRLRRAGQTPAVLYGHGTDPVHLALPAQEVFLALRTANALLEITVDGQKKPVLALPKQIQRDPILPAIDHVDLILVKAGEKVVVDVSLNFVGDAEKGAIVNHEVATISVLAPATDIPTEFEVSVEGLTVGDHILVSGIALPEGVEPAGDPEQLVVSIVAPASEAAEAEGDEAAE